MILFTESQLIMEDLLQLQIYQPLNAMEHPHSNFCQGWPMLKWKIFWYPRNHHFTTAHEHTDHSQNLINYSISPRRFPQKFGEIFSLTFCNPEQTKQQGKQPSWWRQ